MANVLQAHALKGILGAMLPGHARLCVMRRRLEQRLIRRYSEDKDAFIHAPASYSKRRIYGSGLG